MILQLPEMMDFPREAQFLLAAARAFSSLSFFELM